MVHCELNAINKYGFDNLSEEKKVLFKFKFNITAIDFKFAMQHLSITNEKDNFIRPSKIYQISDDDIKKLYGQENINSIIKDFGGLKNDDEIKEILFDKWTYYFNNTVD
jgi:hypothetical protein